MKLPQCIWVGSLDCNVIDVINFLFTDGKVVDGSHDMATISLKCHKFTALPYMGWKGKLFGIVLDPCFLWITALPTLFSGFLCIATQESFLFAFLCHMDQPKVGQLANDKLIGHWYGGGGFQIPSDICFVKIKPDMFPKATTYMHCRLVWCGWTWRDAQGEWRVDWCPTWDQPASAKQWRALCAFYISSAMLLSYTPVSACIAQKRMWVWSVNFKINRSVWGLSR